MMELMSLWKGAVRPGSGLGGPYLSDAVFRTVVAEVAARHGVIPKLITSDSCARIASFPRQEVMWLLRQRGYSTIQIGRALGRDHSTVIHGARAHAARMASDQFVEIAA
jgi:chromosomal replication initiation ATPase DnaA